MSIETIKEFLQQMSTTATNMDLDAHLNLISPAVQLFGVPGFDVIGFDDWKAQCQHEFAEGLIKQVSYEGLKVLSTTDSQIMFKTVETVEANDGTVNVMGIEVILKQGDDGQWRIMQERILPDDELEHDKRNGL